MTNNDFYMLDAAIAKRQDLSGTDKLILAIITRRIGGNGYCWPGIQRLAQDAGVTRQTVISSTRRLEENGLLVVNRHGTGQGNEYILPKQTSLKSRPVKKADQSRNPTTTSQEIRPEPVKKLDCNREELETLKKPRTKKATKRQKPKPNRKATAKAARENPFYEAFKAAFDEQFPTVPPYDDKNTGDFVQLAAWQKEHSKVTPEEFAETARKLWGQGQYSPSYANTMRGLCARWRDALAKLQQIASGPGPPGGRPPGHVRPTTGDSPDVTRRFSKEAVA